MEGESTKIRFIQNKIQISIGGEKMAKYYCNKCNRKHYERGEGSIYWKHLRSSNNPTKRYRRFESAPGQKCPRCKKLMGKYYYIKREPGYAGHKRICRRCVEEKR